MRAARPSGSGSGSANGPPKRSPNVGDLMPLPMLPNTLTDDTAPGRERQQESAGRQLGAEERVVALLAVDTRADRHEPPIGEANCCCDEDGVVLESNADHRVGLALPFVPERSGAGRRPDVVALVSHRRPAKLRRRSWIRSRTTAPTPGTDPVPGSRARRRQRVELRLVDESDQPCAVRRRARWACPRESCRCEGRIADRVGRLVAVAEIVERPGAGEPRSQGV